jgi:DNA repair protein RadA/Sms
MAKKNQYYVCNGCGAETAKWSGQCSSCGEWNSLVEVDSPRAARKRPGATARPLSEVESGENFRIDTGISEFNLVCGGGIVPGSVILMGGEPGIGKSTMALQVAHNLDTLYVSGEESPAQIKSRASRLGLDLPKVKISVDTVTEDIVDLALSLKPQLLVADSIQTLVSADLPGAAGSVNQIRDSASRLADMAKRRGIPVILVGHITKDGAIAGPKVLEHLVDTVLYFEGDFSRDFRMLRAFKNRYGSVNEVGLFRMTKSGLEEVREKNRIFLNSCSAASPGSAVSAAVEGSRTILFEVQSLVTYTAFSNPRRMADGLDINRLIILAAVLERHAGLKLGSFDVFINLSGGFHISETAADLAVAAAIASSMRDVAIPEGVGLMGRFRFPATCVRYRSAGDGSRSSGHRASEP